MTKKTCIFMSMLLFLCVSFSISTAQMLSTPEMYQLIERRQRLLSTQQIQTPKFPEPNAVAKIALPDTVINMSKEAYNAGLDYRQMSMESLKYAKEFLDKGNIELANKYINDSERLSKLSHSQIEASFRLLDGAIDMAQYKIMYEAAGTAISKLTGPLGHAVVTGIKLGVEYDVDKTLVGADKAKTELFKKALVEVVTDYVGAGKIAQKEFGSSRIYPVLSKLVGSSEFKEDVLKSFMRLGGTAAGYTADEALKFIVSLGVGVGDSTAHTKEKTTSTVATPKQPAPSSEKSDKAKTEEPKPAVAKKGETPPASSSENEKPKQVIVTPKPASPSTSKSDAPKISDITKGGPTPQTQQTLDEGGKTLGKVEGTLKQLPQTIKTQSPSQKQETLQTLDALKQKLMQLSETLKQLQNESAKKQAVSTAIPAAKIEAIKIINMPPTLPPGLPMGKVADKDNLTGRNQIAGQQQLTPTKVEFTQAYDGLFTQSADFVGSRYGSHSGSLTDGTRVNVTGDSRQGDFTGSFSGQTVAETGYTPATHNNSAFSGESVGRVSAKGFKEGDLKGTMTVTVPAGAQTVRVTGDITIKTDGSLTMPNYSGPVTVNATGEKVGTMSGSWSQSKTR